MLDRSRFCRIFPSLFSRHQLDYVQVMGDQAVVDPSKVEALVMGQVARRKNEHEARNQAAKLTPQERRDKKKRKLLEDTSKEMQV